MQNSKKSDNDSKEETDFIYHNLEFQYNQKTYSFVFFSTLALEKEVYQAMKTKKPICILTELARQHPNDLHIGENPLTESSSRGKPEGGENRRKRESKEQRKLGLKHRASSKEKEETKTKDGKQKIGAKMAKLDLNQNNMKPPKASKSKQDKEVLGQDEEQKGSNPFWTNEQRVQFIRLIHQLGRQWQKVSTRMGSKNPEQCRSHAQKYFNNLERLQKAIERANGEAGKIDETTHIKIQQYEDESKKVLSSLLDAEEEVLWPLFPMYLKKELEGEHVPFQEKMRDIGHAIRAEFDHYEQIKTEKKEFNRLKKRNKQKALEEEEEEEQ